MEALGPPTVLLRVETSTAALWRARSITRESGGCTPVPGGSSVGCLSLYTCLSAPHPGWSPGACLTNRKPERRQESQRSTPSKNKQMNCVWFIHALEYYTLRKMNEMQLSMITRIDCSIRGRKQGPKYCFHPCNSQAAPKVGRTR